MIPLKDCRAELFHTHHVFIDYKNVPFSTWVFFRVSMDGKPQDSVLLLKVQGSVSGLAVDWIHQLLYWTNLESGSVSVGVLDGSTQRPLITGLYKPSAVAVDPLQR